MERSTCRCTGKRETEKFQSFKPILTSRCRNFLPYLTTGLFSFSRRCNLHAQHVLNSNFLQHTVSTTALKRRSLKTSREIRSGWTWPWPHHPAAPPHPPPAREPGEMAGLPPPRPTRPAAGGVRGAAGRNRLPLGFRLNLGSSRWAQVLPLSQARESECSRKPWEAPNPRFALCVWS